MMMLMTNRAPLEAWPGPACLPGLPAWLAWRTRRRRANQGVALQSDRGSCLGCLKPRPHIAPQSATKGEGDDADDGTGEGR